MAIFQAVFRGFSSLNGSKRELYLMYVVKFLESYGYFCLSLTYTLYMTENFHVDDLEAGFSYGVWGTMLTLYGMLLAPMIDHLGIKKSMLIGFSVSAVSRVLLSWTTSKTVAYALCYGPIPAAGALGVPVMTIGIKRYTHAGNRGFAFGLFYSIMNIAAVLTGFLVDFFRRIAKHGFNIQDLPQDAFVNSGPRLIILSTAFAAFAGLLVVLFGMRDDKILFAQLDVDGSLHGVTDVLARKESELDAEASSHGECAGSPSHASSSGCRSSQLQTTLPEAIHANTAQTHTMVAATHASGRSNQAGHVAAVASTGLNKGSGDGDAVEAGDEHTALFAGSSQHEHDSAAVLYEDAQGSCGCSSWWHALWTAVWRRCCKIQQELAMLLVNVEIWKFIVVSIITVNLKQIFRHVDATLPKYLLRAFGCNTPVGLVYSINPAMIILLVPIVAALTTSLPHFDMIHYGSYVTALSPLWIVGFGTLWSAILFVVQLSLGEAVWSPRWYDYAMSIAPNGREGIFTVLAGAPLFLAQMPTGAMSGYLLQRYCPDNGQQCGASDSHSTSSSTAAASPLHAPAPALTRATMASKLGHLAPAPALNSVAHAGSTSCDGRSLWFIVFIVTLSSPLTLLLFQRWLRPAPSPAADAADVAKPDPYSKLCNGALDVDAEHGLAVPLDEDDDEVRGSNARGSQDCSIRIPAAPVSGL